MPIGNRNIALYARENPAFHPAKYEMAF